MVLGVTALTDCAGVKALGVATLETTGEADLAFDLADAGVKIGVFSKSETPVKLMSILLEFLFLGVFSRCLTPERLASPTPFTLALFPVDFLPKFLTDFGDFLEAGDKDLVLLPAGDFDFGDFVDVVAGEVAFFPGDFDLAGDADAFLGDALLVACGLTGDKDLTRLGDAFGEADFAGTVLGVPGLDEDFGVSSDLAGDLPLAGDLAGVLTAGEACVFAGDFTGDLEDLTGDLAGDLDFLGDLAGVFDGDLAGIAGLFATGAGDFAGDLP